jgi:hypothetical protein
MVKKHHIDQYQTFKTDESEAIDNFDELNKLGQCSTSTNPLEKVDIQDGSMLTFINQSLKDYKLS